MKRVNPSRKSLNEWLAALCVALLILALVIVTADDSPLWIYQGF